MVYVLKFGIQVAHQKGIVKRCRPRSGCFLRISLIMVIPVCYSDMLFVNSSLDLRIKRKVFEILEHLPYHNICIKLYYLVIAVLSNFQQYCNAWVKVFQDYS